jgi:hypothetical protein
MATVTELDNLIRSWHHDRNLIEGATDKDQYMKLIQEAGELSDNICKGRDISDVTDYQWNIVCKSLTMISKTVKEKWLMVFSLKRETSNVYIFISVVRYCIGVVYSTSVFYWTNRRAFARTTKA